MSIFTTLAGLFKPAAELIDNLHTSDEEKLSLKAQLLEIETGVVNNAIALEVSALEAKASIIIAEAKSDGWLTRSWRPIVMLLLTFSILAYWFGFAGIGIPVEIIDRMYSLVQIGVGGYIASRGAEKVVPQVLKALKSKEQV